MSFYEFIIIVRQDLAHTELDKIVAEFTKIISNYKGQVIKREYWGLRKLAYEIRKNRKGHYYFLGIEASQDLLMELKRKIKTMDSVIRHSIINVDAIQSEASQILADSDMDTGTVIDVTADNKRSNSDSKNSKPFDAKNVTEKTLTNHETGEKVANE